MTIVSLFIVHRSPFSVSWLADFFTILLETRAHLDIDALQRPTPEASRDGAFAKYPHAT